MDNYSHPLICITYYTELTISSYRNLTDSKLMEKQLKEYMLHDFIYKKFKNQLMTKKSEGILIVGWGGAISGKGHKGTIRSVRNILCVHLCDT